MQTSFMKILSYSTMKIASYSASKFTKELLLSMGILLAVILLGLFINYILFQILSVWYQNSKNPVLGDLIKYLHNPGKLFLPTFSAMTAKPYIQFPFAIAPIMKGSISIVFITASTWVLLRVIYLSIFLKWPND